MCNKFPILAIFILILLFPIFIYAVENQSVDVKEIVKKADELYRSRSSYAQIEMQIVTPHWERTLTMDAWTKGMDKTFIRIKSPKKEEGVATLRIGNEMWNYLPRVNKVMKIPPSMMMGSWMGSDFDNNDLVHEFSLAEDYTYKLISLEGGETDIYYVELIPKEGLAIVWSKVIAAIRKNDYMPVWQKFYDEKNQLMRQMNYRDFKQLGGRQIPSIMEMIPKSKEGNKTIIRYVNAKFDSDISEDVFTLRNLRSK